MSKIPIKVKKSEQLDIENQKMEDLMKKLKGQIEEERNKMKNRTKWVAGEEGPISKIDPNGSFAKKLLSKKKNNKKDINKKLEIPKEETILIENKNNEENEFLPPIGSGGNLWGSPPNEEEESKKFQEAIKKIRGEKINEIETNSIDIEVNNNLLKKKSPTMFTYFDSLFTKDIITDKSFLEK